MVPLYSLIGRRLTALDSYFFVPLTEIFLFQYKKLSVLRTENLNLGLDGIVQFRDCRPVLSPGILYTVFHIISNNS